jgi:hypothetical protein
MNLPGASKGLEERNNMFNMFHRGDFTLCEEQDSTIM